MPGQSPPSKTSPTTVAMILVVTSIAGSGLAPSVSAASDGGIGFGFWNGNLETVEQTEFWDEDAHRYSAMWANDDQNWIPGNLDRARDADLIPVIHWYYWGDWALKETARCIESTGCYVDDEKQVHYCDDEGISKSNCDLNKDEWDDQAQQLAGEIVDNLPPRSDGSKREAIVTIQLEFNRGEIVKNDSLYGYDKPYHEVFNGYLEEHVDIFESITEVDVRTIVAFGEWDHEDWPKFGGAVAKSSLLGGQLLWSSKHHPIETAATRTEDILKELYQHFGPDSGFSSPIEDTFIYDWGVSTWGEDGNFQYNDLQKEIVQDLKDASSRLRDELGLHGFVLRTLPDGGDEDEHHGGAECCWGFIKSGGDPKPAYTPLLNWVKAESSVASEPASEVEAENMLCTDGAEEPDSSASGGAFWNLWTNGHCDASIGGVSGDAELQIVAQGDPALDVWPEMEAWLDGSMVGNWTVDSTSWTTYSVPLSLTSGGHDLEVHFTNDYVDGSSDRNLWLDVVYLVSTDQEWSQEGEDMDCTVGTNHPDSEASGEEFWNIWSNGHCAATITGVSGDVSLQITAQGDPADGIWPEMEAWVDGQLVGSWTVDEAAWRVYSVPLSLAVGDHDLEIHYTNNAAETGDRNLWLDIAHVLPQDQEWSQEGEDMDCTVGTNHPDSEASGDEFWNIWSNGHCAATITGVTGDAGLQITAQGDPADDVWPEMEAWVDGQLVGSWTVDEAAWEVYGVPVSLGFGDNSLEIHYTNNAAETGDRNLWVDIALVASDAIPVTIRDDDGGMDDWYDFDFSDDTAVKRLILPSDALIDKTSAQLHVFARAAHCGGSETPHTLTANGNTVATYNSCNRWSETDFGWSTFNVPLSYLTADATNSFEITDGNTWNDLDHHFALDTDTDEGRTDAKANLVDQPGELMWYLVIS